MTIDERDYVGKTDRELLIEIYVTLQENCGVLEDHECRIREIELSGSKEATEAIKRVEVLEEKVNNLQSCYSGKEAVEKWYETKLGQAGLIAGIFIGVLGFGLDLWFRFRNLFPPGSP